MSLHVQYRIEKQAKKQARLRKLGLAALTFSIMILGAAICFGLAQEAIKYFNNASGETAIGALASDCNRAYTQQGIRDKGGCRCLAEAAIGANKLNSIRVKELSDYFYQLETTENKLKGKPPSALELSRNIGLIFGHPFLSEYASCSKEGFSAQ